MTTLIGEIEKVGAYARGPKITRADIDAVAAPQLDAVVFEMTDAIGAGSFDQAASVLGELFQMQEPPPKDPVVPGPADAADLLRPAGPGGGKGEPGGVRPVGNQALPGG